MALAVQLPAVLHVSAGWGRGSGARGGGGGRDLGGAGPGRRGTCGARDLWGGRAELRLVLGRAGSAGCPRGAARSRPRPGR